MKLNHYKTKEENLAFICGFAYYLGLLCARKLVYDEHFGKPIFKTINHRPVAFDPKTGKMNGLGIKEVSEVIPSAEEYLKSVESSPLSFSAKIRKYLFNNFRNRRISKGTGIPKGYSIYFSANTLKETVSKMHPSNAWALQYLGDVYRKGKVIGSAVPDKGTHLETKKFFYSVLEVTHNGEKFRLQCDSRLRYDKVLELEHYTLSKIDKIK